MLIRHATRLLSKRINTQLTSYEQITQKVIHQPREQSRYSGIQLQAPSTVSGPISLTAPPNSSPPVPGWMTRYFPHFFTPNGTVPIPSMAAAGVSATSTTVGYEENNVPVGPNGLIAYLFTTGVLACLVVGHLYERYSGGGWYEYQRRASENEAKRFEWVRLLMGGEIITPTSTTSTTTSATSTPSSPSTTSPGSDSDAARAKE